MTRRAFCWLFGAGIAAAAGGLVLPVPVPSVPPPLPDWALKVMSAVDYLNPSHVTVARELIEDAPIEVMTFLDARFTRRIESFEKHAFTYLTSE